MTIASLEILLYFKEWFFWSFEDIYWSSALQIFTITRINFMKEGLRVLLKFTLARTKSFPSSTTYISCLYFQKRRGCSVLWGYLREFNKTRIIHERRPLIVSEMLAGLIFRRFWMHLFYGLYVCINDLLYTKCCHDLNTSYLSILNIELDMVDFRDFIWL